MVIYPNDWEEKKLGEEYIVIMGQSPASSSYNYNKKGLPLIQGNADIMNGMTSASRYTSSPTKICYVNSTILSVRAPVGTVSRANQTICLGRGVCAIVGNEANFIYYLMKYNEKAWKTLEQGSTFTAISGKDVRNFKIFVPTDKKEQRAIADTLSTFDTHIKNLSELIEKKKAVRDGALDDLMSGRTRLKGFSGEWEVKKFDDAFRIIPNNTLSRDKLTKHGNIGNVHYGDVLIKYGSILTTNNDIPRIKEDYECSAKVFLQRNDIVIADTAEDETVGKAVQIGDIDFSLVAGLHTIPCRPIFPTAPGYLGYYINCKAYHDQLMPYITGIKVSSISKASIKKTEISIPSLPEQQAIADTLTALDNEISNLEAERDKMIQIRDGAMNDLLTGRVRLKVS